MRYFNYGVIVVVLVACALLGRGYRGSDPLPALQADLKRSLDEFWRTHGTVVEVLGTPERAEVRASVDFPSNTGPRQQGWMNAFIPFVASRHPGIKLGPVRVVPLVDEARAHSARRANAPLADAGRAEMAQRALQTRLDAALGAGKALILVDSVVPPLQSLLNRKARTATPSFGGAPVREVSLRARDPVDDMPPPRLLGVLVLQVEADSQRAITIVMPSLGQGQLRTVVLPKLP